MSEIEFNPNLKSLKKHNSPAWFNKAKFGIFIHWGLYSVPAYAPTQYGDITETIGKQGFEFHNKHNPYAEWYQNSLRVGGPDYSEYHLKNYGVSFPYESFSEEFNKTIEKWNPNEWASYFKDIGAKYVVFTTKHHEGFTMWPSKVENPYRKGYYAKRNVVKELTDAVRNQGLKMGYYYSGGLDWTFNEEPIFETCSMIGSVPQSEEYGNYVYEQFKELIDTFHPSILWNDIAYPLKGKLLDLISYYYNHIPDGVVNDRWTMIPKPAKYLKKSRILKAIINRAAQKMVATSGFEGKKPKKVGDFSTSEYTPRIKFKSFKWEACRGIGRSFGYNQMEQDEHHILSENLIFSLVDIVSKNGNLLLNIGPDKFGNIPELQKKRLDTLGKWLHLNGEGIFDSEPWRIQELKTNEVEMRFTHNPEKRAIYCFLNDPPKGKEVKIKGIPSVREISILGHKDAVFFSVSGNSVMLTIPNIDYEFKCVGFCIKY